MLQKTESIEFTLTPNQQEQFNQFFTSIQAKYLTLQGNDYMATVRRLGLIAFRMAMILSALRILETGAIASKITCEQHDFQTVLRIIGVLVKHASHVFSELPPGAASPYP